MVRVINEEIEDVMDSKNLIDLISNKLNREDKNGKIDVRRIKKSLTYPVNLIRASSDESYMTLREATTGTRAHQPRFEIFTVYAALLNLINGF